MCKAAHKPQHGILLCCAMTACACCRALIEANHVMLQPADSRPRLLLCWHLAHLLQGHAQQRLAPLQCSCRHQLLC